VRHLRRAPSIRPQYVLGYATLMANRKSPPVSQTVPLQVRVPAELLTEFREMAEQRGETVSVEVRHLMRERIRKHRSEKEPAA
jgi:hypothetical protein